MDALAQLPATRRRPPPVWKLDLRDRVQIVVLASESGLVQPGAGAETT